MLEIFLGRLAVALLGCQVPVRELKTLIGVGERYGPCRPSVRESHGKRTVFTVRREQLVTAALIQHK